MPAGPLALLALGLIPVSACLPGASEAAGSGRLGSDAMVDTAVVERVVDGDTVVLDIAGVSERVRLIGVDAPESVAPDQPVHCYGVEASSALSELLPPGTQVRLSRDVEARDRYDRLLLYLHRADDDLFVNEWLVANGYAEASSYEPNTSRQATFDTARQAAVAGSIGLWGACDGPEQPLPRRHRPS